MSQPEAEAPIHVLIADDSEELVQALQRQLTRRGFRVTPVVDSYQALARAIAERPDAIVLDVHMPAGGGPSVLDRISENEQLRQCAVIFMTGDSRFTRASLPAELPLPVSVIYKPFDASELDACIRTAVQAVIPAPRP